MTKKERIVRQIRGQELDRIPMLGGWNLGVRNVARLAGLSVEEYLKDPLAGVVRANRSLDVDAMLSRIVVPTDPTSIRDGHVAEATFENVEPEAIKDRAEAIPDSPAKILAAKFDPAQAEQAYRREFETALMAYGDMAVIPTVWEAPANVSLYFHYGYVAYLAAVALYPDEVERIYWEDAILCRARNEIVVRLYGEYDLPPILFAGHDVCVNTGPMISPEFLRRRYWPHARRSLEPFVEAGIRMVHHCDGNVMPIVGDMVEAGFTGFQGFQYEDGVDPYDLAGRRGPGGERPLLMAGLSVTRTLPFGAPRDVMDEVDYCLDYTDGGKGLFLFTSNVTGVEVPVENLQAAYGHLARYDPRSPRPEASRHRAWPWAVKHPG